MGRVVAWFFLVLVRLLSTVRFLGYSPSLKIEMDLLSPVVVVDEPERETALLLELAAPAVLPVLDPTARSPFAVRPPLLLGVLPVVLEP